MNLDHLIQALEKKEDWAQKRLYETYVKMLLGVAKRYVKQHMDAEDVVIRAFVKIFDKIHQFGRQGSFEAWMRKIVVNESLMFLRKKKKVTVEIGEIRHMADTAQSVQQRLEYEDLLEILDDLPTGYRTVFNLYVIEGYKHREIADLLGISINTSKSQLILAKKKLRKKLGNSLFATELRLS